MNSPFITYQMGHNMAFESDAPKAVHPSTLCWTSLMKLLLTLILLFFVSAAMSLSFERTAGIIGILALPEVYGSDPCASFVPQDIPIFKTPTTDHPIGKIYVAKPWTFPKEGGCEGLLVKSEITDSVPSGGEMPTMEFGYEQPGAIVLMQTNSWFKIVLSKDNGWVRVTDVKRFLPIEQLLKGNGRYLRKDVLIPLQMIPTQHATPRLSDTRTVEDVPVKLLSFKRFAGALWIQVESLKIDPCTQEKLLEAPISGWVPFHGAKLQPSVWFWSRGC